MTAAVSGGFVLHGRLLCEGDEFCVFVIVPRKTRILEVQKTHPATYEKAVLRQSPKPRRLFVRLCTNSSTLQESITSDAESPLELITGHFLLTGIEFVKRVTRPPNSHNRCMRFFD